MFEHKALPLDPDAVIIQFVNNDYGVPLFMQRPKRFFALDRSYLLELLRTRLGWIRANEQDAMLVGSRLRTVNQDDEPRRSPPERFRAYHLCNGVDGYTQSHRFYFKIRRNLKKKRNTEWKWNRYRNHYSMRTFYPTKRQLEAANRRTNHLGHLHLIAPPIYLYPEADG